MTEKPENPPAFPVASDGVVADGITLRDYFAAQIIGGIAADPNIGPNENDHAEFAYRWADAMLKARGGGDDAIES